MRVRESGSERSLKSQSTCKLTLTASLALSRGRAAQEGTISPALFPRIFLSSLAPDPAQLVCSPGIPCIKKPSSDGRFPLCVSRTLLLQEGLSTTGQGQNPKCLGGAWLWGEIRHSSQSHHNGSDVDSNVTRGWKCPRSMTHRSLRKGGTGQANKHKHRDCSRTPILTAKSI